MERDALGMNKRREVAEEAAGPHRLDSTFSDRSAMQWPFCDDMSSMPQFFPYTVPQEQPLRNSVFNHIPSSPFQPIQTKINYNSPRALELQTHFNVDKQGAHQFAMSIIASETTGSFGLFPQYLNKIDNSPMSLHHSISMPASNPFFMANGDWRAPLSTTASKQQPLFFRPGVATEAPVMGSSARAFPSWNTSKPSSTKAQLTIFYAGEVSVYNDVSSDRAQEIMFLASNSSNRNSDSPNTRKPAAPELEQTTNVAGMQFVNTMQKKELAHKHTAMNCSSLSGAVSVSLNTGAHSASGHSKPDDMMGAKSFGPSTSSIQNEHLSSFNTNCAPTSTIRKAVPQVRRESLARFIEKRKERLVNSVPFYCKNKSLEPTNGFDGDNIPSKQSSPFAAFSSIEMDRL